MKYLYRFPIQTYIVPWKGVKNLRGISNYLVKLQCVFFPSFPPLNEIHEVHLSSTFEFVKVSSQFPTPRLVMTLFPAIWTAWDSVVPTGLVACSLIKKSLPRCMVDPWYPPQRPVVRTSLLYLGKPSFHLTCPPGSHPETLRHLPRATRG